MASSMIFMGMVPIAYLIRIPSPASRIDDSQNFSLSDLKTIFPDAVSLVLVYASVSFITPVIPWFLEYLQVPSGQIILMTSLVSIFNGLAYVIAIPILTNIVTGATMPILSLIAAGVLVTTSFVTDPYQFVVLRIVIGSIQAGIPPNLLGGKSGRKGTAIGFLNSARFVGIAIGPFIATSLLGNGEPSNLLNMFATMGGISLLASFVIYLTHGRQGGSVKAH